MKQICSTYSTQSIVSGAGARAENWAEQGLNKYDEAGAWRSGERVESSCTYNPFKPNNRQIS